MQWRNSCGIAYLVTVICNLPFKVEACRRLLEQAWSLFSATVLDNLTIQNFNT